MPRIARRGLLLVLSSPSGAGKTTLARRLLAADPRPAHVGLGDDAQAAARRGRRQGLPLHRRGASSSAWRRPASCSSGREVFGNLYGTPKAPVRGRARGRRATCCSTSTGRARASSRSAWARDVVSVFILPPDGKALERRLQTRAQDSEEVVARRMAAAADRDRALGRVRLRHRQRRPRCELRRLRHPGRRAPEARAPVRPRRLRAGRAGGL